MCIRDSCSTVRSLQPAAIETLQAAGCSDLTVLQCTASYPPSWDDLNLNSITTLKAAFGLPGGLSAHSPGHAAPIAPAAPPLLPL